MADDRRPNQIETNRTDETFRSGADYGSYGGRNWDSFSKGDERFSGGETGRSGETSRETTAPDLSPNTPPETRTEILPERNVQPTESRMMVTRAGSQLRSPIWTWAPLALGAVGVAYLGYRWLSSRSARITGDVATRLPLAKDLPSVSDQHGNYDIDGVSFDDEGVVVSSDSIKVIIAPI